MALAQLIQSYTLGDGELINSPPNFGPASLGGAFLLVDRFDPLTATRGAPRSSAEPHTGQPNTQSDGNGYRGGHGPGKHIALH
jgi:hypothetical protein